MESAVALRNRIERWGYRHLAKPVFFRNDPESVHDRVTAMGEALGRTRLGRAAVAACFAYENDLLGQEVCGIRFKNPLGLSAGFDKDAHLIGVLPSVGFGFAEVGTVTARPYDGNPRPRLHRLPASKALVVNYGLKNEGMEAVGRRLEGAVPCLPLGISIGPTNDPLTANPDVAIGEYVSAYRRLAALGSYVTLNLSCPNTTQDQPFNEPALLGELLAAIDDVRTGPVFLKMSPDLSLDRVDRLMAVADHYAVDGLICSNLTKKRDSPHIKESEVPARGGISGKVVEGMADALIAHVAKTGRFVVIGCGGVFSAEDAYRKIRLGARLIQLITGMIYEGPQLISEINQGLVRLLRRDGFTSLEEAVGVDLL